MIIKNLINSSSSVVFLFAIFCLVFSSTLFIYDFHVISIKNFEIGVFLTALVFIFLPFFHAMGLNNLVYEKNVIKKNNLIIAPVFICLSAPFIVNIEIWFFSLVLLSFINNLLSCYQKEKPFDKVFNSSITISILSFFSFEIIWFYLVILSSLILFGQNNWRNIAIALVGFILPYLFVFSIAFILNEPIFLSLSNFEVSLFNPFKYSYMDLAWFSIVFIISTLSLLELFSWFFKKSIRSRRSFILLVIYLFVSLFITFIYGNENLYYILTPLSVIISNYFIYSSRRKIANLIFIFLLVSSLFYRLIINF